MFQEWLWTILEAILLQKNASEEQKLWHFYLSCIWSTSQCKGVLPLGYAIDYNFGFDFGFWAKLM